MAAILSRPQWVKEQSLFDIVSFIAGNDLGHFY